MGNQGRGAEGARGGGMIDQGRSRLLEYERSQESRIRYPAAVHYCTEDSLEYGRYGRYGSNFFGSDPAPSLPEGVTPQLKTQMRDWRRNSPIII